MSNFLQTHGRQHARPSCPSPAPRDYPNSCLLRWWCHPAISCSVVPFSCPQSFPASGCFQMSQFFTSGDKSIGVSASISVLPVNIQGWFPLGWTGWTTVLGRCMYILYILGNWGSEGLSDFPKLHSKKWLSYGLNSYFWLHSRCA